MQYILIDNFNDTLNIMGKNDGSGAPLILDTLQEAEEALVECCQDGQIVPLTNIIQLLRDCEDFIVIDGEPELEKMLAEVLN